MQFKVMRFYKIFLLGLILQSCVGDNDGILKRSANNTIVDHGGFNGAKRPPMYNKKYIDRAKQNIADDNVDLYNDIEDSSTLEMDEVYNPSQNNVKMYTKMMRAKNNLSSTKASQSQNPSLAEIKSQVDVITSDSASLERDKLLKELESVKLLLAEIQKQQKQNKVVNSKETSSNFASTTPAPKGSSQNLDPLSADTNCTTSNGRNNNRDDLEDGGMCIDKYRSNSYKASYTTK